MGWIGLEGGGMKRQVFVPVDETAQALPASFQRLIRLDHHGAATKTVIRLVACESFMAGVINEYQQAPVSCDQVSHTSIGPVHRSTYVNCQRSKACSAAASSAPSSALGNRWPYRSAVIWIEASCYPFKYSDRLCRVAPPT